MATSYSVCNEEQERSESTNEPSCAVGSGEQLPPDNDSGTCTTEPEKSSMKEQRNNGLQERQNDSVGIQGNEVSGELQNGSLEDLNNDTFSNQRTYRGNFGIKCHESGGLMEQKHGRTGDRENGEWGNDCTLNQVCQLQRRVGELEEEVRGRGKSEGEIRADRRTEGGGRER